MKKTMMTAAAVSVFLFLGGTVRHAVLPLMAQEHVEDLKRQIAALQKRVAELEAARSPEAVHLPTGDSRRWDPLEEIVRMQEEMDRLFQDSFSWGGQSGRGIFRSDMFYDDTVGMKEEGDRYIIEFDMTGLNEGQVDIQVNRHTITVRGERRDEQTEAGAQKYFQSRSYATFMKSIPLPPDADPSGMRSEKKGGTLIITLPKKTT